ncbi:hypothetical protein HDV57DRAFT_467583 [Trichoderma longibrachiatum]|uniref:Uncharacterized protein n=1 Tax=Trichoderma longibrachiatum ATCC 18648 TaxID=983965 RepID=A0A2T4C5T4_TRILO|nr:hypothetical protein M440DRAFT_1237410 [Trichoderma longibrachiatum ATCC 18648]
MRLARTRPSSGTLLVPLSSNPPARLSVGRLSLFSSHPHHSSHSSLLSSRGRLAEILDKPGTRQQQPRSWGATSSSALLCSPRLRHDRSDRQSSNQSIPRATSAVPRNSFLCRPLALRICCETSQSTAACIFVCIFLTPSHAPTPPAASRPEPFRFLLLPLESVAFLHLATDNLHFFLFSSFFQSPS